MNCEWLQRVHVDGCYLVLVDDFTDHAEEVVLAELHVVELRNIVARIVVNVGKASRYRIIVRFYEIAGDVFIAALVRFVDILRFTHHEVNIIGAEFDTFNIAVDVGLDDDLWAGRVPLLGSGFKKERKSFLIEVLYYFVIDKEVEVECRAFFAVDNSVFLADALCNVAN